MEPIVGIHGSLPKDQARPESETAFNLNENIDIFEESKKEFRCKVIRSVLKSIMYQIIITIITIFALFADDLRVLAFTKDQDDAFDIIQIAIMCIFLMEITFSVIAMEGYLFSFFFWLDIVSTITILFDVNMFTDVVFMNSSASGSSTSNISKIASQSKASRAATRAVRLVKLIRLIRVVKLYKSAVRAKEIKQNIKRERLKQKKKKMSSEKISTNVNVAVQHLVEMNPTTDKPHTLDFLNINKQADKEPATARDLGQLQQSQNFADYESKQSKVSQILSDSTIKKVIIVVLLIMFIVPMFDSSTYIDTTHSMDYFVTNIKALLTNQSVPTVDVYNLITYVIQDHLDDLAPLVAFSTPFAELPSYKTADFNNIRTDDTVASTIDINPYDILDFRKDLTLSNTTDSKTTILGVINIKAYNEYDSYFSIGKIIFVCIVLGVLLHFFTKDTDQLIIQPIQDMIEKVKAMARNPTAVANDLIEENQYETAVIYNAIVKIGSLLSLVFGNAGAQIIGTNMMKEGDMNPLTGGKKKCAIYGFCDIRNFTDATEVLQEDIMIFVNQIGQLVHSAVYRYGGSANKNIGDAFLLVWQIPETKYVIQKNNHVDWLDKPYLKVLSDFSLLSFIKVIVKINKEPKILKYRTDKRLLDRLGPDFQVKMGFGLHIGWAIEGAIGSEYKIDASYLSPNVNMASRLEAATKQYRVPILVSSALYEHFSSQMNQFCRKIDIVTVKGSKQPIGLYTVDLDLKNISPPADKALKYPDPDDMPDVDLKRQLNMEYLDEKFSQYDAYTFIEQKKELREVLMHNTTREHHDFRQQFELGFDDYIKGYWDRAINYFGEALKLRPNDGPCLTLIDYMNENIMNGKAPATWRNYRELTEK